MTTARQEEAALVRFLGATLAYGRHPVVDDVTFSVRRGAFVGLVGPNGSGKTTLLRAVLGVLRPRRGQVERGAGRIGYVPQRFAIDPVFPVTVGELVAMGRYPHHGPLRRPTERDRRAVDEVCARLGIAGLRHRPFRDLSGGQQQRALLARALAAEPEMLVLDEPTNGMDLASEHGILELVRTLHREGRVTVLFVTHLLHLVADAATELALVGDGRVVFGPRREILTSARLSDVYGVPVEVLDVGGRTVIRAAAPPLLEDA